MAPPSRIAVMSAALADQIAAGEVVERPAAVVKELVENAIDAEAARIEVELEDGGMTAIRVIDDGRGIHPDDLSLALQRHATSKLRRAEDLVEISTHGFRGEALASIAAVGRVRIRSRTGDASIGSELSNGPDEAREPSPAGMPVGTQIEIGHLFASVPARRKFMRSEATEIGHCNEAVVRAALVHPEIHFTLRHRGRELLDFPVVSADARVEAVLNRRGRVGITRVEGEHEGVRVRGYFGDPRGASRSRQGTFIVVRKRVVSERSLRQVARLAYGDLLADGVHPLVCLFVEPPRGTVDVNVHPQKTEVRFADPQTVYAAVRHVLREGLSDAPWSTTGTPPLEEVSVASAAREALEGWAASPAAHASASAGYRLGTRATGADYQREKEEFKREVDVLRERLPPRSGGGGGAVVDPAPAPAQGPQLLTCLPGHVAVFRDGETLLAVDLLELRSHLVYRRLARDLGGEGVAAQALLSPVVVKCTAADVEACASAAELLSRIGIVCEPFGEDAVVVRAVPAQLRHCVDDADVGDLMGRVLPWLQLHRREGGSTGEESALAVIARTRGGDPAPRLARRWIRELHEEGALDAAPGVRRLDTAELLGRERD